MPDAAEHKPLRVCLVSDDDLVVAAVRMCCPPPHHLDAVALTTIVDEKNSLSEAGREVVRRAASYDVILLDWEMERAPVINTLCYHVRQTVSAPLMALCRGTQEAEVAALAAGADDALTFPFYPPLLQAKKAAYHRLVEAARGLDGGRFAPREQPAERDVLHMGELHLDRAARKCTVGENEVDLTFREFALLEYFLENAETACTRDQILDHVWGIQFDTGTNMVDVYVYFLRRKLAGHGFEGIIQTVRGYGYRLTMDAA